MPQLNPNPWFLTMLLSWLIILLILQPKFTTLTPTNTPTNKLTTTPTPRPWHWPWS